MDPELLPIVLGIPVGLGIGYLLFRSLRRRYTGPQFLKAPVPPGWWPIVERQVPIARGLAPEARERLLRYMQLFLAKKRFEGCRGVAVTEEMTVVIAAQACLLIVNLGGPCYPRVTTVLVYPGTFVGKRFSWVGEAADEGDPDPLLGEAWRDGVVVLAWDQVESDSRDPSDGENVVFHEFAHQLDFEDGASDGVPVLDGRVSYQVWATTMQRDYDRLRAAVENQAESGALGEYGAKNPAEFFAVATEAFFEKPQALAADYPDLYRALSRFYRQDPKALAP